MIFEVRSIATRRSLRTPQDGQKQPQDDPWTPQGGSKMAPRLPQDAPRRLQEGYTRRLQDDPRPPQDVPGRLKTVPRRPKITPRRSKTAPRRPKTAPRRPKTARRPPHDSLQNAARPSPRHCDATPPQDHSKTISHSDLGLDLVLNTKPGTSSAKVLAVQLSLDKLVSLCSPYRL